MTCRVGIFVFEDAEVLDFAGPYEVFTTAARVQARLSPAAGPVFTVYTIAQSRETVRARAGLNVVPDHDFSAHPNIDMLLVPGGVVTEEMEKPPVIEWIGKCSAQAAITASVCTGSFLLAKAGLLDGKRATTHWEDLGELESMFPSVSVVRGPRWVDEGAIVTSAGISAGIDMSLHLVERLAGRALAEKTARQMDFDWTGNPH
jgi:transcriptional regulator GlxA family with amidase domain